MPKHVKEVFAGTSGILSGLCSEKIWIDHSTTDYNQVKQFVFIARVLSLSILCRKEYDYFHSWNKIQMMSFNDQVAAKGAFAIEAPITGGLEALKKGQMTVLMAGNAQKVAEVSLPSKVKRLSLF